ncbi:hypothetical protein HDU93_001280 [Gonapodya sp. JEL0774]|nr:hypothetical protein HDU93_001280 [Gonapodya sp. JEL0774]
MYFDYRAGYGSEAKEKERKNEDSADKYHPSMPADKVGQYKNHVVDIANAGVDGDGRHRLDLSIKLFSPRRIAIFAFPLAIILSLLAFSQNPRTTETDDYHAPTNFSAIPIKDETVHVCAECDPENGDRLILAKLRRLSQDEPQNLEESRHSKEGFRERISDSFLVAYSDYVKRHRLRMQNITPETRFLIHRLDIGGLGNRFPGMLSSFILSMLQDRVWLLYDENGGDNGSLPTYFEPATVDGLPLDYNWIPNANRIVKGLQLDPSRVNLTKDPGLNPVSFFPQQHWLYDYNDWILEDFSESSLYKEPVTMLDWFPTMEAFYSISQLVMRVRGFAKQSSHSFFSANFLFDISLPEPAPLVDRNEVQSLLAPNTIIGKSRYYVVGLQIRTLKETESVPPTKYYVDVAISVWRASRRPWSKTRFFLATDAAHVRDEVRSELLVHHKTIVDDCALQRTRTPACHDATNLIFNHLIYREDSDITFNNIISRTVESDTDGLIDMKMLSMCDDLVVTYGSSFGFVAAAWGGIIPYVQGLFRGPKWKLKIQRFRTYVLHLKPGIVDRDHKYPDGTRNQSDPEKPFKLDMFTFFFYKALSTGTFGGEAFHGVLHPGESDDGKTTGFYESDPAFDIPSPSASSWNRRPTAPSLEDTVNVDDELRDPNDFNLDVERLPYVHQNFVFPRPQQPPPSLDEAMKYYTLTQGKKPFRLYKQWYKFAVKNKCNVLGAAHLSKTLQHLPQEITPDMVEKASKLPRTGTLYVAPLKLSDDPHKDYHNDSWADPLTGEPLESPNYVIQNTNTPGVADNNWQSWMGPFAIYFPRFFRMVLNMEDWPRIFIPGKDCGVVPTPWSRNDSPKSPWMTSTSPIEGLSGSKHGIPDLEKLVTLDLHNPFNLTLPMAYRQHHGFFYPKPLPGNHFPVPVPIFSQATLPDCYADILVPLGYAVKSSQDQIPQEKRTGADVPFANKAPVAIWRGTTTGAEPIPSNVTEWNRLHRHRLVKHSLDLRRECEKPKSGVECFPGIDAKFVGYLQMFTDFAYQEHVRIFGEPGGNHMPYEVQFYHRFLIDVDGNSFSQRFHTFLREAKSLVFRARGFVDWSDHWVVPYIHYIPLRFDWSDLVSAIQWAIGNPTEAQKVAEQGYEMGRNGLRYEDIQCHMFAVMSEYENRLVGRELKNAEQSPVSIFTGLNIFRGARRSSRLTILLLVVAVNVGFFLTVSMRERDIARTVSEKNSSSLTPTVESSQISSTEAPSGDSSVPSPTHRSTKGRATAHPTLPPHGRSIPGISRHLYPALSDITLSSAEKTDLLEPFDVEDFKTLGERVREFFIYHRRLRAVEDWQTGDDSRSGDSDMEDTDYSPANTIERQISRRTRTSAHSRNVVAEFTRFMGRFEDLLFPWVRPTYPSISYLYRTFSRAPRTRGLVMTTAKGLQSRMAMVGIMSLRATGCTLPIEFMYAGDDDLPPETRRKILSLGDGYDIVMRDITTLVDDSLTEIGAWAIKPFSIMFSSFTEVVFADADVVWFYSPEEVFSDPVYIETGTLFYYDRSHNAIMARQSEHNQDSAVVAVDKSLEHNFYGLLTTCRLNLREERDRVIYKVFLGDKETFWIGWEMAGSNGMYGFNRWPSAQLGYLSRGDQDPVEVVTNLNFTIDGDKADESSILRICSYQSAHLHPSGTRLHWFNGGPLRAKIFGEESAVASRLEYWAVERHSRWDINDFNVFCLRMREGLNITVDELGNVVDTRPDIIGNSGDIQQPDPFNYAVFKADYEHHEGGAVPHRLGQIERRVVAKLEDVHEESDGFMSPASIADFDDEKTLLSVLNGLGEPSSSFDTDKWGIGTGNDKKPPITEAFLSAYASYAANHVKTMSNVTPESQFLVDIVDMGGLGNRFPGQISAFIFSMLLNRTFLVYDRNGGSTGMWTSYFQPLGLSRGEPLDVNWNANAVRIAKGLDLDPKTVNMTKLKLDPNPSSFCPRTLSLYDYVQLTTTNWTRDETLKKQKVLCHWSFHYQVPNLWGNKEYRAKLLEWFPTMEAFYATSKLLMRVKGAAKVDSLYAPARPKRRYGRYYVIGVHIRTFKESKTIPPTKYFVDVAVSIWRSSGRPWDKTRFFLSTDHWRIRQEFERELLLHHDIATGQPTAPPSVTTEPRGGTSKLKQLIYRADNDQLHHEVEAVIDMRTLAACDELVLTYGSSFGYVAAGWGGITPTFVNHLPPGIASSERGYPDGTRASPQEPYKLTKFTFFFYKALSSEPCTTQLLFKLDGKHLDQTKEAFTGPGNPMWMHFLQVRRYRDAT